VGSVRVHAKVPAGRALDGGVNDLRLSDARDLGTALGKALYEISK
jgi:hypothetical protein